MTGAPLPYWRLSLYYFFYFAFIGVFFAYTMNDTNQRGEFDADQNVKVLPKTGEDAPGGFVAPAHSASAGGGGGHDEHGGAGAPAPSGGAAPAHH